MSKIRYTGHDHLHPFLKAMLAYNDYDYNSDPTAISTTSLMKPTNMVALERHYCQSDKEINLEALIPSVMGNAMHALLEKALQTTSDDLWKQFGIPKPEKLEIRQEVREVKMINGYTVTGKYDILYMYDGSEWHLADLKTMSVWALMLDPKKKKEDFVKQLSIYRWLNQKENISDVAEILYWYTDWSAAESKRNPKYPQSRIGHLEIALWSLENTEKYIKDQLQKLTKATQHLETTGTTGVICSDDELWKAPPVYKYYRDPTKLSRSTKNFDTYEAAHARLMKDRNVGTIITVPSIAKRCNYCSVTEFCEQYKDLKLQGAIDG